MIKNPYKRPDHRAAFEKALELLRAGLDRWETSRQLKELDPALPRGIRQTISAKAGRLLGKQSFKEIIPLTDQEVVEIETDYQIANLLKRGKEEIFIQCATQGHWFDKYLGVCTRCGKRKESE